MIQQRVYSVNLWMVKLRWEELQVCWKVNSTFQWSYLSANETEKIVCSLRKIMKHRHIFAINCYHIQSREQQPRKTGTDLQFRVSFKFCVVEHHGALVKCVNNIDCINSLQVYASETPFSLPYFILSFSTQLGCVLFFLNNFSQISDCWESASLNVQQIGVMEKALCLVMLEKKKRMQEYFSSMYILLENGEKQLVLSCQWMRSNEVRLKF